MKGEGHTCPFPDIPNKIVYSQLYRNADIKPAFTYEL